MNSHKRAMGNKGRKNKTGTVRIT